MSLAVSLVFSSGGFTHFSFYLFVRHATWIWQEISKRWPSNVYESEWTFANLHEKNVVSYISTVGNLLLTFWLSTQSLLCLTHNATIHFIKIEPRSYNHMYFCFWICILACYVYVSSMINLRMRINVYTCGSCIFRNVKERLCVLPRVSSYENLNIFRYTRMSVLLFYAFAHDVSESAYITQGVYV